jgi:SpoVK/Ycf46/Vps4 family AAA+-type ATPase
MTIRTATLTGVQKSFRPVLRLWGLRLLLDLDGHRYVMDQHRVTDSFTLAMLGMDDVVDMSDANLKDRLDALWRQRKTMKLMAPRIPRTSILGKNIAWLAKTLSLNVVEGDIVGFLALAQQNMGLERLLEKFGALRTSEVHMVLATVLGHPTEEIARALHHAARLIRSNLVWTQGADKWSWSLKLGLLAGIGDLLALEHADPFDMFASNFRRCPSGPLDLANYPHLEQDLRVLEPYLRQALLKGHHGVNVLLYGPPGTGKTELAKALARAIGAPLFEVASEDRNGNVIKGEARFGAFQLAQGVLGGDPRPVLLFDEVEDVFQADEDGLGLSRRRRSGRKAWVNNMLSQNAIPAIWVTNVVAAIDPAYLRRFDYVLEVGVPPRSVRANILEQYTNDFQVSPGWQNKVATQECLTPAAIERAAKVTRVAISVRPDLQAEGVMSQLLNNGLALLGEARMPSAQSHGEPPYRHDLVNADSDLGAIALGLKGSGVGRLCLYGPPGTGKTAWGRHLAQVLDRPLHVHRGSDLLSPYVGETEARMARMFRMAEAEGALLLLDEADSFFRDRATTDMRGWEVSQVNEMLTQTESYKGIFVASTNLMDRIDAATLRRFDLKIRFCFMTPDQTMAMLANCLGVLGLHLNNKAGMDIQGISNLTPGDFAVVMRQSRLEPVTTASEFVARLARECSLKGGPARRTIGFRGDYVAA